jgi:3-hydroxyisobutyrate dehydrogenase
MRAAVLGLGEAGSRYAADLVAAGWDVSGHDPAPVPTPQGVLRADSTAAAAMQADLAVGLSGPAAAAAVAAAAGRAMRAGSCYADLNSTSASRKREVAAALADSNPAVAMADVAVLAPVGRSGAATPLLISGPGAQQAAEAFRTLGADVEVLDAPVGAAAERKLLRSVFMKALAAAVLEATAAARAAGCEPWLRDQMAAELGPGGHALVDRLLEGSAKHAGRRISEVEASRELLRELGVPTPVCDASLSWLVLLREHGLARQDV